MALDPGKRVTQYSVQVWNMESGLPGNSVFAIQQTRDGFLWIGTQIGLVRFDGIRFEIYSKENTQALTSNVIRALYEDSDGNLWIGTSSGGLSRYREGQFINYSNSIYQPLNNIRSIIQDRWGNLWIGSFTEGATCINLRSIDTLDTGELELTTYTTSHGLPHNQIRFISKDADGDIWITTTAGIVKVVKPGVFREYAGNDVLPFMKTACLYEAEEGNLWIGTGQNALFCLKNSIFTHYGIEAGIPHPTITYLFQDRMKNTWIGTDGGGLTRMSKGVLSTLPGKDGLADGFVYSIYEDREGSLWVGTLDGGLHQLIDNKFTTFTTREGLVNDYIECVHETRAGHLWVGTKGGMNRLEQGKVTKVLTTRDGLADNRVLAVFEDTDGNTWIGTWGGLHLLLQKNPDSLIKMNGLSDDRVSCIIGDRKGNTWIGTSNGLNRYNRSDGTLTLITTQQGLAGNFIESIFEDSRGILWISSSTGINTLKDGIINDFQFNGLDQLENIPVRCFYEDQEGTLWMGTYNGLIRWRENRTTLYTVQSGLLENHVYTILEDEKGFIWLGGRSGISRIRKKELEDFSSGKIHHLQMESYHEMDGMKSRWCTGMACKTSDGRFWFPTGIGITMIDPNQIKLNPLQPPLIIEKIVVDGETIHIHNQAKEKNTLELSPGKKRLEFYYTAVSFINPGKIRFKLKLEGYDRDWIARENLRITSYTGLSPGRYTLKVIACNRDGIWNKKGASFSFYLQPYFYQTTWFYIWVAIFVILVVFSFYRFRIRQLRNKQKELSNLVEQRTRDLKERNAELEIARQNIQHSKELIQDKNLQLEEQSEKLKELDRAKSRFFANISHEFRTPLTLIKGPLEQLITENPDKKLKVKANMMLRNSNLLLNLVEQLLELAKIDSGQMKLQAWRHNIVPIVKQIVMCFESLAQQNNIDLSFQAETEDMPLTFDQEKIERIITNLLSNAFNYTPSGGKIGVFIRTVIRTAPQTAWVEITVRDTGTGIPADWLPHIFDRFYRGEAHHEYKRKGTGIGLNLVRELVELHHGEIMVKSNCSTDNTRGTEFIVRLPQGNSHLKPEEIINSPRFGPLQETSGKISLYNDPINKASIYVEQEESEYEETDDGGDEPLMGEKYIILVVDDNADVRKYIKGALQPHFIIKEAANGREGIMKAGLLIPDLVISDIMMPELDGYELCATLKNDIRTSHIPIILLTAKASDASKSEGLETGADDYITKPFNTNLLRIRVRNLIRIRRQLQHKIKVDMMLRPAEVSVSSLDQEFLKEIQIIIEKYLSDPEFNVEQMAKKLNMHPSTLRRKVKALTGEGSNRLIRSYRLKRAAQLLKANFGNITEVTFAVGFSSTAYFTKCFKEEYNQLPHTYANDQDSETCV